MAAKHVTYKNLERPTDEEKAASLAAYYERYPWAKTAAEMAAKKAK